MSAVVFLHSKLRTSFFVPLHCHTIVKWKTKFSTFFNFHRIFHTSYFILHTMRSPLLFWNHKNAKQKIIVKVLSVVDAPVQNVNSLCDACQNLQSVCRSSNPAIVNLIGKDQHYLIYAWSRLSILHPLGNISS